MCYVLFCKLWVMGGIVGCEVGCVEMVKCVVRFCCWCSNWWVLCVCVGMLDEVMLLWW